MGQGDPLTPWGQRYGAALWGRGSHRHSAMGRGVTAAGHWGHGRGSRGHPLPPPIRAAAPHRHPPPASVRHRRPPRAPPPPRSPPTHPGDPRAPPRALPVPPGPFGAEDGGGFRAVGRTHPGHRHLEQRRRERGRDGRPLPESDSKPESAAVVKSRHSPRSRKARRS